MRGFVVARSDPLMAVTDDEGRFTIKHLPAGKWTFQFWHERPGYLTHVVRDGAAQQWPKGRVTLPIETGANDMGTILLSPSILVSKRR
jgi:hypothetical protein